MNAAVGEWAKLAGNIGGALALVYLIIDSFRNWGGSPELKVLKEDMQQNHKNIQALIRKLSGQSGSKE